MFIYVGKSLQVFIRKVWCCLLLVIFLLLLFLSGCGGSGVSKDVLKEISAIEVYSTKEDDVKPIVIDDSFVLKELKEYLEGGKKSTRPASHGKSENRFFLVFKYKDGTESEKMLYTFLTPDQPAYIDIDTCYKIPEKFNSMILASGASKLVKVDEEKRETVQADQKTETVSQTDVQQASDSNNKQSDDKVEIDKKESHNVDESTSQDNDIDTGSKTDDGSESSDTQTIQPDTQEEDKDKWKHPNGYFTLKLPEGWNIRKNSQLEIAFDITSNGGNESFVLVPYPTKFVPKSLMRRVNDASLATYGLTGTWGEKNIEGKKLEILSINYGGKNTICGLVRIGDFTFQMTYQGGSSTDKIEPLMVTITSGIDDVKQLPADPTCGVQQLLGKWGVSNTQYSDAGGGGTSETWIFYDSGIVAMSSFTSFSGGSGDSYWSASDESGAENAVYTVLDGYIYFYSETTYIPAPFSIDGQVLQIGNKTLYRQ